MLKLKTNKFKQLTRSRRLDRPTHLADAIYRAALPLLAAEADGTRFRLIGTGVQMIEPLGAARPETGDLLAGAGDRPRKVKEAMDRVRGKFGEGAIKKGRSL